MRAEAIARGLDPREVDLLLSDALGKSTAWLFAHPEAMVGVDAMLERRLAGEPLQYIVGRCDFYGRTFQVDDRVLIPRPETEILVEQAIVRAPRNGRVLDAGTGSGCIAISLALERPDLRVAAVDVSIGALAVARRNRDALGAPVMLAASDMLDAVRGRVDLIVSNPPYIAATDVESLQTEVRDHEPRAALTPGPRGTEAIERLLTQSVAPRVMFEIGFGQIDAVRQLASRRGYTVDAVVNDLAGIARVVVLSAHAG